ncbi:DMT family transporter [Halolamina litorea]|uniref:DMT family transporter n=1 Tax=Halolamina litorea TaxID=1515593 RepID=A0ABD6BMI1_9EURY|nr:EamA family transporter [Halolamina litorea]
MSAGTGLREYGVFALLALVWGSSYAAIDVGLRELPPLLFAGLRYDAATLFLFGVVLIAGERVLPRERHEWTTVLIGGTFLIAINIGGLFVGQQYVPSSVAAILQSVSPVLTPVFAWVLLDARLGVRTVVGSVLGLLGVAIIGGWEPHWGLPSLGVGVAGDAVATLPNDDGTMVGVAVLFGAAAAFALGSVLLERLPPTLPTTTSQAWMMAVGAIQLHLGSVVLGEPTGELELLRFETVGAVLYLGVVCGAVGYLLYYELLNSMGPVRASVVNYVTPVVAAVIGFLFLGEQLGLAAVVGFVLVAAGFAGMQWDSLVAFQARIDDAYRRREYLGGDRGGESLREAYFGAPDPDEDAEAWEWGPQ